MNDNKDIPVFKFNLKLPNKIEQVSKFIRMFCLFNNMHLTASEVEVFAYFIVYGVKEETKRLLEESKILTNKQSIKNMLTKFKKLKLLIKTDRKNEYIVNKYFQALRENKVFTGFVKFDKEN